MKQLQRLIHQILFLILLTTAATASHAANDWRIGLGLGPNFETDLVDDELESDVGFSIWGDYFFDKKWFGHLAYDYFSFKDEPEMNSGILGVGYEFDRLGRRWFPHIILGASFNQVQDFPIGIGDEGAFGINVRPGIEYALTNKWFLGLAYEYIHLFISESDNGVDVALPLITLSFRPNRFPSKKTESRKKDGDDDRDGVLNSIDECPNTPRGAKVDELGCELEKDSDKDGVVDGADQCPDTPRGTEVDRKGCPREFDSDKDGVVNSKDQCPSTPRGVKVDQEGCEPEADADKDDDQDGVKNPFDQCLDTPPNTKVNGFGCQEAEKIQMKLKINFDSDKDVIKPEYFNQLNKVARLMKRNPEAKLRIEGHTDSTGSLEHNMDLSRRRANAVRTFLIGGDLIDESRVQAEGYGPTQPVATNETAEGRAQNRRILATFYY